jgi:hypothetical protein
VDSLVSINVRSKYRAQNGCVVSDKSNNLHYVTFQNSDQSLGSRVRIPVADIFRSVVFIVALLTFQKLNINYNDKENS